MKRIHGLYLITDEGENLIPRVERALDGGVQVVQLRRKNDTPETRVVIGRELRELCHSRQIPFIVNDDMELALALDADGVHLGQEDGSVAETRRRLGANRLIGVSTHNLEEARRAQQQGADYIGFGAMYPTASKAISHLAGPAQLAAIRSEITLPVVAIGGIDRDNAPAVIDAGADAIAVISALLSAVNPRQAAQELSLLFNRRAPWPRGVVLTVAGSDSSGGAGIQADLKSITLLGSYGASVITALTAQNTCGVTAISPVSPEFVAEQLSAVFTDLPVHVVKSGMLHNAETIRTLCQALDRYPTLLIADPVMIAKGGGALLQDDAINTLQSHLIPRAYLLTPNIPEAERLTGLSIRNEAEMEAAAVTLHRMGAANVLLKGGHRENGDATDILYDGSHFHRYPSPRIASRNTHGTGCSFASAIATFLAQGEPLPVAVAQAKTFITEAIHHALPLGSGQGPINHFLAARASRVENGAAS
jgi:hydroxymethylpyrimidine kinase/phosphomethylpyrimidine kinase/thiamine-phosphate diphosphorylase